MSITVVTFFSQLLFSRPPFLLLHVYRFEQTTHTIAPLLWDAFVTVTLCRVLASVSPGFAICFPRQLTSEGSRAGRAVPVVKNFCGSAKVKAARRALKSLLSPPSPPKKKKEELVYIPPNTEAIPRKGFSTPTRKGDLLHHSGLDLGAGQRGL